MSILFINARQPMNQAKKEAVAIAKEHTSLSTVDKFYWFTRKETFFSIVGKDDTGKEIVVIIPKSGETARQLNQADGLTEAVARQLVKERYSQTIIEKASLGIYNDQPVWEIVAENQDQTLTYYLLAFENGEEVNIIQNL